MTEAEIDKNLIFLFVRGSQAYGLNNANSDEDLGGISIPSLDVVTGLDIFDQKDDYVDETGNKTDKVVYNILKAIDLLENNNPNIIDFLYAPERCIKICKPEWEDIISVRDKFLSKKIKWSYYGYALAQINRVRTHRGYLLHPMVKPFRSDFNLPDISIFPPNQLSAICRLGSEYIDDKDKQNNFYQDMELLFNHEGVMVFKKYLDYNSTKFAIEDFKKSQASFLHMISSVSGHFLKDEYQDMAKRELKFLAAENQWNDYKRWEKNRNPKRKLLEEKCGFDCKHMAHCVRLLKMGTEILQGKGVNVDRTNIDREELYNIRMGNVLFDDVEQIAMKSCKELEQAYKQNTILPLEVDHNFVISLKRKIIDNIVRKKYQI